MDEVALTHRELAIAALVWTFFGVLNGIGGHGRFAVGLHAAAALATLGAAAVSRAGRPVLGFHLSAGVWVAALAAYSMVTGTLSDGTLTLVLLPVLATYTASAMAGLAWLGVVACALIVVWWSNDRHWIEPLFTPTPALREVVVLALGAVMWLFSERSRRRSDVALDRLRRTASEARTRAEELGLLKKELEEKNQELDEVAERLSEAAKEVFESNVALEEARDAALVRAKEASDFLTRMSHEIRTPLNGVLGITDVLLGGKLDREARELVTIIESSGRVLRRLVDEVLDLARLDAGKLQLVEEPFDPLTVAEDVADLFAAQAAAKGVVLVTIAPEELPARLLGDPMRVRQVLQNLVGNAVKFTTHGHVRIGVEVGIGTLVYRVEDTGTGLSPDALGELFSEYAQAREGARRGGSGLGLVIAQRLARAMGGDVEAQSSLGKGSVFVARFALPRASTGRAVHSLDGELSGTITTAGVVVRDPLVMLAMMRTAMHVNIQLVPLTISGSEPESERSLALVFTEGPMSRKHAGTPHVLLRAPNEKPTSDDGTLALLLPPRRTRLVRAARQGTGRVREPTLTGALAP
ncbi:MAG: hypothetical protein J0L92_39515, partial [Deltaproteobacteria bacterium]|nr:hypothetical protein [Deltaproteobacteria bacterium]